MIDTTQGNILAVAGAIGVLLVVIVGGGLGSCAAYNSVRVWNAQTAGEAELAQARSNRQIKTLEAKASMESAKDFAEADVIRARGQAKANGILQNSLGGPAGYLQFLKIEMMKDMKQGSLVYVPTEGQLPITEAGRSVPVKGVE